MPAYSVTCPEGPSESVGSKMEIVADMLGRWLNEPRTKKLGTQRPGSPRAAGLQRKPLDRLQSVDSTSFLVGRRGSCAGLLPARLEQAFLDLYIYVVQDERYDGAQRPPRSAPRRRARRADEQGRGPTDGCGGGPVRGVDGVNPGFGHGGALPRAPGVPVRDLVIDGGLRDERQGDREPDGPRG